MAMYYVLILNFVTMLVYGIDKFKAKKGNWRIPESTLLLLAVLGGGIGAWGGMKVWHHKMSMEIQIWCTCHFYYTGNFMYLPYIVG